MKKAVYAVGRFQPPTIGHQLLIEEVMKLGGDAFVFVSYLTTPPSDNPLTSKQKTTALEKMFPTGVTFVDTSICKPACGGPVAANDYLRALGYTDITLVAGSDRQPIFGEGAPMWKKGIANGVPAPKFKGLIRTKGEGATSMSGTMARGFARTGKYDEFAKAVKVGAMDDETTRMLYDAIRARSGGRRKTRRKTKQSRASSKALYRRGSRSRSGS